MPKRRSNCATDQIETSRPWPAAKLLASSGRVKGFGPRGYASVAKRGRIVDSTPLLEEPISPELVLVDRELAVRAREASPSPPWLLPVLAEARQRKEAAAAVAVEERSAADAPRREPEPSIWKHLRATAVFGCALVGLVALMALVLDLVPTSKGPTFVTARAEQAATPTPTGSSPEGRAGRGGKRPKPRGGVKPTAVPKTKTTPARSHTRSAVTTPAPKKAQKPKNRAAAKKVSKPTARAVAKVQRVFSWHRAAAAVYYQFYLRRGAATIYETRTVKLTAALPAGLKLRPGTYQALVRPAIPGDAGIVLGAAILEKTIRV
jgi:hypothetical protein